MSIWSNILLMVQLVSTKIMTISKIFFIMKKIFNYQQSGTFLPLVTENHHVMELAELLNTWLIRWVFRLFTLIMVRQHLNCREEEIKTKKWLNLE